MTFSVNGVDFTPYIMPGGLEYQLSDIDDPDAGRTMAGEMRRGKITEKDKWSCKFRPLTTAEISTVLNAVSREFVTVSYLSPRENAVIEKVMYVGDRKASHCVFPNNGGTVLWSDLSFGFIEK